MVSCVPDHQLTEAQALVIAGDSSVVIYLQASCIQPVRQALHHQPFHPDSEEYLRFRKQTEERLAAFRKKYPHISI